jgi:hypothetical protein
MTGVALHEQASIAIPAIDLTARIGIYAVIKDLRFVEYAFSADCFNSYTGCHKYVPFDPAFELADFYLSDALVLQQMTTAMFELPCFSPDLNRRLYCTYMNDSGQ